MNNFTTMIKSLFLLLGICFTLPLVAQNGGLNIYPTTSCSGKSIAVNVYADSWVDVTSMQFTLAWDNTILEYIDTDLPNNTFSDIMFGTNNTANGYINVSWFDGSVTLDGISLEEEVAFVLHFNVIGDIGETSVFEFSGTPTVIEFTYNNEGDITVFDPVLDPAAVALELPELASTDTESATNGSTADGSISVNIDGGTSPYSITWSNGMMGSSINNLMAGNYHCTVTDSKECSSVSSSITVSTLVATNDLEGLSRFDLSPNPASDVVNLQVAFETHQQTQIRLLDVSGKAVFETSRDGQSFQLAIPVDHMPGGTYLVELSTDRGKAVEKILVRR